MTVTAYWSPNQASIAQIETYTYSAPNSVGNTYTATINGKSVTYASVSGDTAASVASNHFALLSATASIPPELTEITFSNNVSGQVVATAKVPGTPFANVPGTAAGLVLSTGNGLSNGITTTHTTANASPSDVNDPVNWLRINTGVIPPTQVRQLPQASDLMVISNTSVPMLWSLDQLAGVTLGSPFIRWQDFTGTIGLPENNPNGYVEWRATYLKLSGPIGSTPAGGLQMVLGQGTTGTGPTRERYDLGSSWVTLTVINAGQAADAYGVRFKGVHTNNTVTLLGGVSLGIAMLAGEVSNLNTVTVDGSATIGIGLGVGWTTSTSAVAASMEMIGGTAIVNSAPPALILANGASATPMTDGLNWSSITMQNGSTMTWLAGGTITTLTMTTSSTLDKSQDARSLTVVNSTIDGDTCVINDPLNAVSFTNATSVKQQTTAGPFRFTGTRTVKVV